MTLSPEQLYKFIEELENDDDLLGNLEDGMVYYCGTHDMREGYKHALLATLHDQFTHHAEDIYPEQIEKLYQILIK